MRAMRRAAKVDDNQREIVAALRGAGATVTSIAAVGRGCPDILIGIGGVNLLAEIKDGSKLPSQRKLTYDEAIFHERWLGQVAVIESVADALELIKDLS